MLTPALRLSGFDEDIPAYLDDGLPREAEALRYRVLAAAIRIDGSAGLGGTGLIPYADLSLMRADMRSSLGESVSFTAPRVAFGLSGPVGSGALAVEVSGGSLGDGVRDTGLKLGYALQF